MLALIHQRSSTRPRRAVARTAAGWVALSVLALACEKGSREPELQSRPASEPASSGAAARLRHSPGRAPLKLEVRGPQNPQPNSEIEVVVALDRRAPDLPVDLRVSLPPGATLVNGAPTERIDGTETHIERRYRVRLGAVPSSDLQVTAEAYDQDVGVHGRGIYRFGRPEPHLPEPSRADRSTQIGKQNFGRAVELKPQTPRP